MPEFPNFPLSSEEINLIAEKMKQHIREEYEQADGYYEEAKNNTYRLGIEEGATGIVYMIEQGDDSFSVRGYRIS